MILHDDLVWLSKSFGLFCFIGLSVVIVAYTYWPSNKKHYDDAARAILREEDRP